jgi:hypothetical protein
VLDTPIGKVGPQNLKSWDHESGTIIFERNGNEVEYKDLPEKYDIPGDINKMLWKGK